MVVDADGAVVVGDPDGHPGKGDTLESWAPGAVIGGPPARTGGGRWVRLEQVIASSRMVLVHVLDRTCEHVAEEARQLSVRRTALAELAGATAREMNDPMTIVQGRLELLRAFALEDPEAAQRHCGIALEHAHRLSGTLHNLRLVGASDLAVVEPVSIQDAADEAVDAAGIEPGRVRLDLHPADICAVGQPSAVARVLAGVFRALGAGGREPIALQARRRSGRVVVEVTAQGRRRPDLDALPLGLVTALLDAMGGAMRFSGTGLVVELADAGGTEPALDVSGELLVVGQPRLAERIAAILERDAITVIPENSAESALVRVGSPAVVGVVTQLLLPERGGLSLAWDVERVRPDLPLAVVIVTPERVTRLPANVRTLTAPLSRSRLVSALTRL